MKKFWIQITALTLIIFGGFYFYSNPSAFSMFFPNNIPVTQTQLQVGGNVLKVEIADTPEKRTQGLGGRDSLNADSGMLFVFTESKVYQFWMKGMIIPLDIIFINGGSVVDLLKNVPPPPQNTKDSDLPKLSPTTPVDMVLEISAGYIDSHGIKVGDMVSLVK